MTGDRKRVMTVGGRPTVSRVNGASVVTVDGDLDLATAPALWAALESALAEEGPVVLDMSAVTFIDSSGLSVLLRAYQVLGMTRSLKVRGPSAQARRLFEVAGVASVIDVES
jgi:anti-sigma B factor antagonist